MDFTALLGKLLPLYGLIALGYIAGKKLNVAPQSIARLVIYIIVPVVFFGYTARLEPSITIIFLPLLVWGISAAVLGVMWLVARRVFRDNRANLTAATAASVNSGYFGVPVFIMLFGEEHLGIYMLTVLGFTLNELSLAFYTLARGHYDWHESVRRLLRLPSIYAGALGIAFAFVRIELPTPLIEVINQFRGCYVVLGMLMLGLGLSQLTRWHAEWRYLGLSLLGRFGVSTLLVILLMWINSLTGHWLTPPMQQSFWLLCTLPLANNIVAYATELNLHPEQAATAVMTSTVLSAVVILLSAGWLVMQ